jgi:hypothetical protein
MTYEITRADMRLKVERALHDGGDLYTFDDIMALIKEGKMQSFTCGDTWIVTQVNEFPRKKVLEIALVVGEHMGGDRVPPRDLRLRPPSGSDEGYRLRPRRVVGTPRRRLEESRYDVREGHAL